MAGSRKVSQAAPAGFRYLPGPSGWCLVSHQHAFCPRMDCTCTKCPGVHHTLAGQAPRVYSTHDPMPGRGLDEMLANAPADDDVEAGPVVLAPAA